MELQIVPYVTPFPAKGSHLLKEFANTGTPILDSLVRESIQNSLDAAKVTAQFVQMKFITGEFVLGSLYSKCNNLEEMLAPISKCIPNHFLCFRDYNTEGLTGNVVDMGNQNTGNYFKLVLDIGNEQTGAGAGGSCGIGKSLYFRLGIKGFVIYYSRFKQDNGTFESRLIAMMVENERGEDSIIPPAIHGTSKTGIAYWGKLVDNQILPITDEEQISDFLKIFDIEPYKEQETGTTVILPFINNEKLLTDNKKVYENGKKNIVTSWHSSMGRFLMISIQRWYFARLNNRHYKNGPQLKVEINGEPFTNDKMAPCFKIFQSLYNRAAENNEEELNDILSNNENVTTVPILLKNYKPLSNKKTGTLAYVLADTELLEMTAPNNRVSPYIYCDTNIDAEDSNTPIIAYCRKPGMIVNYETVGEWLNRVPTTDSSQYLMAIFVLNSKNRIGDDSNLEEYVRKMEPNDHMKWVDGPFNDKKYSFIRFSKNNVSKVLNLYLSGDAKINVGRKMSELGRIYSWILPPEDFGKRPTPRPGTSSGGGNSTRSHRKMKYSIVSQELFSDSIVITYSFEATGKKDAFGMELLVSTSDGKNITLKEWTDMRATTPFHICMSQVSLKRLDGNDCSKTYPLTENRPKFDDKQIGFHLNMEKIANSNLPFNLNLKFDTEHTFKIEVKLTIGISSREVLPTIKID